MCERLQLHEIELIAKSFLVMKKSRTLAPPSPPICGGWGSRRPVSCQVGIRMKCTMTFAASPASAMTHAFWTHLSPLFDSWRARQKGHGTLIRRNGNENWRLETKETSPPKQRMRDSGHALISKSQRSCWPQVYANRN